MRTRLSLIVLVIVWFTTIAIAADQWPSSNILARVLYLKVGQEFGTAFTIERSEKQYLVTARHLVNTLPQKGATIEIFRGGTWKPFRVDIAFPDNEYVDVAVLLISADLTARYEIETGVSVTLGQEGYFFGYPDGLHTLVGSEYVPLVKRASLSAVDVSDPSEVVWYLDGFSNPGFSGGPVAFYNYKTQKWGIAAVVAGFKGEQARVRVGKNYAYTKELVNSGILIAYSIRYALEAIDRAAAQTQLVR